MKLEDIIMWHSWPVGRRREYFIALFAAWCVFWIVLFTIFSTMTGTARKDIERAEDRLKRVEPVVQEIQALQKATGNLASLTPLAAAQQLSRDLNMERQLSSIRPTQLAGGQEGVQLLFESLDRNQVVQLLETIRTRSRMKILSFVFNHRMDNAKRADLQLVLVR